jgi:hypothetical protein
MDTCNSFIYEKTEIFVDQCVIKTRTKLKYGTLRFLVFFSIHNKINSFLKSLHELFLRLLFSNDNIKLPKNAT